MKGPILKRCARIGCANTWLAKPQGALGRRRPRIWCSQKCAMKTWHENHPRVSRAELERLRGLAGAETSAAMMR